MVQKKVSDNKHLMTHETDVITTIDKLKSFQNNYYDVNYFYDLSMKFLLGRKFSKSAYKVSIMGLTLPEEILYAVGAQPLWILGGSFGSAIYADKFVPRDTDSVSKSSLGYLREQNFPFNDKSDLLVIPITSDSSRKIAHMLSGDIEVFPLDVPPLKCDPSSKKKWMSQIYALVSILEKRTKIRLSKDNLFAAAKMVNAAKLEMKRLLHHSITSPGFMPEALVMFIINTYYFTEDINEWVLKLKSLNDKIRVRSSNKYGYDSLSSYNQKPNILVAGSPVYFPNFKIPFLFSELNVNVSSFANELTRRVYSEPELTNKKIGLGKLLENIAFTHYLEDSSPAFIDNISRLEYIASIEKNMPLDGVIYHVLKGQIDYDFELEHYENFFATKKIPVFRLETDYSQQDIEQLRIRTEAFVEMISAKYQNSYNDNYVKMRA